MKKNRKAKRSYTVKEVHVPKATTGLRKDKQLATYCNQIVEAKENGCTNTYLSCGCEGLPYKEVVLELLDAGYDVDIRWYEYGKDTFVKASWARESEKGILTLDGKCEKHIDWFYENVKLHSSSIWYNPSTNTWGNK